MFDFDSAHEQSEAYHLKQYEMRKAAAAANKAASASPSTSTTASSGGSGKYDVLRGSRSSTTPTQHVVASRPPPMTTETAPQASAPIMRPVPSADAYTLPSAPIATASRHDVSMPAVQPLVPPSFVGSVATTGHSAPTASANGTVSYESFSSMASNMPSFPAWMYSARYTIESLKRMLASIADDSLGRLAQDWRKAVGETATLEAFRHYIHTHYGSLDPASQLACDHTKKFLERHHRFIYYMEMRCTLESALCAPCGALLYPFTGSNAIMVQEDLATSAHLLPITPVVIDPYQCITNILRRLTRALIRWTSSSTYDHAVWDLDSLNRLVLRVMEEEVACWRRFPVSSSLSSIEEAGKLNAKFSRTHAELEHFVPYRTGWLKSLEAEFERRKTAEFDARRDRQREGRAQSQLVTQMAQELMSLSAEVQRLRQTLSECIHWMQRYAIAATSRPASVQQQQPQQQQVAASTTSAVAATAPAVPSQQPTLAGSFVAPPQQVQQQYQPQVASAPVTSVSVPVNMSTASAANIPMYTTFHGVSAAHMMPTAAAATRSSAPPSASGPYQHIPQQRAHQQPPPKKLERMDHNIDKYMADLENMSRPEGLDPNPEFGDPPPLPVRSSRSSSNRTNDGQNSTSSRTRTTQR